MNKMTTYENMELSARRFVNSINEVEGYYLEFVSCEHHYKGDWLCICNITTYDRHNIAKLSIKGFEETKPELVDWSFWSVEVFNFASEDAFDECVEHGEYCEYDIHSDDEFSIYSLAVHSVFQLLDWLGQFKFNGDGYITGIISTSNSNSNSNRKGTDK